MKEEELKIKFPYVWKTLIKRHDDDFEYCEELICEEDEESAKIEFEEMNEIRRFFRNNQMTFDEVKKDLKESLELNQMTLPSGLKDI